jgi:hypothetical protein
MAASIWSRPTGAFPQTVEQDMGRHQEAGGAIAALEGEMREEGLLQGAEVRRAAQAFDGHDPLAVQLDGRGGTGDHGQQRALGARLHRHRAGPADTDAAAEFRARQAEILLQPVEQGESAGTRRR